MPGIDPVVEATLDAVATTTAARPGWMLVVKAKGERSHYLLRPILDRLEAGRDLDDDGRLLVVPYDAPGHEPCPAGWLIEQMAGGIGLGSVQVEALTRGKPAFSYYPVVQETPYQAKLASCGLAHASPGSLAAALGRWMDRPEAARFPYDWFRDRFDPFADDRALDRIVALLWKGEATSLAETGSMDRVP